MKRKLISIFLCFSLVFSCVIFFGCNKNYTKKDVSTLYASMKNDTLTKGCFSGNKMAISFDNISIDQNDKSYIFPAVYQFYVEGGGMFFNVIDRFDKSSAISDPVEYCLKDFLPDQINDIYFKLSGVYEKLKVFCEGKNIYEKTDSELHYKGLLSDYNRLIRALYGLNFSFEEYYFNGTGKVDFSKDSEELLTIKSQLLNDDKNFFNISQKYEDKREILFNSNKKITGDEEDVLKNNQKITGYEKELLNTNQKFVEDEIKVLNSSVRLSEGTVQLSNSNVRDMLGRMLLKLAKVTFNYNVINFVPANPLGEVKSWIESEDNIKMQEFLTICSETIKKLNSNSDLADLISNSNKSKVKTLFASVQKGFERYEREYNLFLKAIDNLDLKGYFQAKNKQAFIDNCSDQAKSSFEMIENFFNGSYKALYNALESVNSYIQMGA